jgi:D-amino-acid dehydrogenase
MTKKVAVIGAGILGINTAYFLAKKGMHVSVYDSNRYAGMETSYSNGAQISVCNSETWTQWENVSKGIQWMFKDDAPLLFNPIPNLLDPKGTYSKYMWILNFFLTTALGRYKKNSENAFLISLKSRDLYFKIADEEGIEFDLLKKGIIHFYNSQNDLKKAISKKRWIESMGCEWEVLSQDKIFEIEPSLRGNNGIVGGIYTKSDATGDIHKYCINLSEVLKKKYEVNFHFQEEVQDIIGDKVKTVVTKEGNQDFDSVIICAGVETQRFANKFGDNFRIYPVKGYSVTIDLKDDLSRSAAPFVSLLDDPNKLVASRLGNKLRIAGTAELAGYNKDIRANRIKPLLNWVEKLFPEVRIDNYTPWAGLRPMSSDMVPIIRESKKQNIFYNSGHGHLGWTMGTYSGKLAADLIET